MYVTKKGLKSSIRINKSYEGERIEEKIQRITNNKEPISDGAPLVYTNREEGVMPAYNPKTDKWEVAVEAMDKVSRQHITKREENLANFKKKLEEENSKNKPQEPKNNGGAEPIQGTEGSKT